MHSKVVGALGVVKTTEFFVRLGIPVFGELFADNSEVDLIVIANGACHKLQVKTASSTSSGCGGKSALLTLRRVTPGTRKKPCEVRRYSDVVDVYALYVYDKDVLLFIDAADVKKHSTSVRFSFEGGRRNSRIAEDYLSPDFLE